MHFGNWSDSVHNDPSQIDRQERAKREHMEIKALDPVSQTAHIENMNGTKQYTCSLTSCNCADFQDRRKPCKHIYKLYYALNNESTKKSKRTALLCCIFGGWFGLHYFYTGRFGYGLLYFFTCGLFCFGWFYDIYRISTNKFNQLKPIPLPSDNIVRSSDLGNGVTATWRKNW